MPAGDYIRNASSAELARWIAHRTEHIERLEVSIENQRASIARSQRVFERLLGGRRLLVAEVARRKVEAAA